jgi:hypothetical protein
VVCALCALCGVVSSSSSWSMRSAKELYVLVGVGITGGEI